MKRHKTAAAILAALFATTSLTTGIAMAEQAKAPQTEQSQASQSQTGQSSQSQQGSDSQSSDQLLKVSQKASYAMQEVQMARLALRNDSTDQAKSLLQDAKAKFGDASSDAITADMLKKDASGGGKVQGVDKLTDSSYFAVGSDTMISESLSAQPQNGTDQTQQTADASSQAKQGQTGGDQKTADASSQTKNGQTGSDQKTADASQTNGSGDQGRSIFRVNEIDMVEVAALVPHDSTVKAIDQALTEIDNGNTQKAEQQLASVSDNMVFATLTGRATPNTSDSAQNHQGDTQTQMPSKS
ncbi:YfdX protein [Palleronia aestuarii]|uniref:YfdX protein n=1 Tax=Palleronia aestuarii TaxID=568105 RepID=A0A2W7QCM6_9RHOB|nr:YfdX family protein [Palleronia aestuarii]PZX19579.1 YfdX protein [Palleronia aestuarii]